MSNVNDLDHFLEKYELFPALIQIAKLSKQLFNANKVRDNLAFDSNKSKHTNVTQWGLFFIAHRLILRSNDEHDKPLANFEYENLLEANSIFNGLDEPFFELNEPFFKDDDLIDFLVRRSQQQFWSQEYYGYKFARNYLILVELDDKFKGKIKVNIKKVFYENWDLTIRDFLIIGFAIFKHSLGYPYSVIDNLYGMLEYLQKQQILKLDEVLTREIFDNFIELVSGSYSGIQSCEGQ